MHKFFGAVIDVLITNDARKATKYVSDKYVINATRKAYNGKIDKKDKTIDIIMKIGKPNYTEREFIKKYKKNGGIFPMNGIKMKFFKKKKK